MCSFTADLTPYMVFLSQLEISKNSHRNFNVASAANTLSPCESSELARKSEVTDFEYAEDKMILRLRLRLPLSRQTVKVCVGVIIS